MKTWKAIERALAQLEVEIAMANRQEKLYGMEDVTRMTNPAPSILGPTDPSTSEMNTFKSFVTVLADVNAKDDIKLKAAQELIKSFEVILSSPLYPTFLEHAVKVFLKILQEGEPYFISEYNIQQVRKLILEMLHRLPTNDLLKPYVKPMLSLMLKLLELENEENVLVCLRIIIELHKQYRPTFNPEIQHFLQFVKSIYSELPNHLPKIFEPRPPIVVNELSEINMEELLQKTFTVTVIQTGKKTKDGTVISYNLIPKAVLSLKVLQELPIIVVLMYQLYKQNVPQDVADFIPLVMTTITLQPSLQHRQSTYFNKEVFVDFMGAQIKTLSFLAFIIKMYQEVVAQHSDSMVQGMLGLLQLCPMEVAHLRRELLIATRHILATDLRIHFVPHIERLFDEDVLLGRGWTTHESLRPLAYSTLADLVHHVRQHLGLQDLIRAVHLFSKNVHDESLATNIQTVSCKLLLNLVDCIRIRSEQDNSTEGCELLMRMLEVFVLKFKTIAKIQLPILMNQSKQQTQTSINQQRASIPTTVDSKDSDTKSNPTELLDAATGQQGAKDERPKFGVPSPTTNYSVTDYRSLVKTLVFGVKTITWGCASCKTLSVQAAGQAATTAKPFQPDETLVFVRLVRWALRALDIYTLPVTPPGQPAPLPGLHGGNAPTVPQRPTPPQQTVRTKEEKEVLEHFSGVFSMMNSQTFREIFSTTIDYMVERIHKNSALQTVANSFLANPPTSPIFATILVEYLLERMKEMGSDAERSNLYLRLFKLVFGSVTLFPTENENMLRPHLHQIVNRSMELAMSAKEPLNYFYLLRALFRSIGGGSHDLLYQEFLPLLPNLLEGLNRLQSGLHKQQMKDLFVELCLTVPVRLSSLLPYLPMLMDPLVSALNGSQILISQGLRTLELCVDNLQPDFLYEHIQPVRADLMQALWRTLRNPDQVAQVAFRVLGKFGGGNRKMMIEPQRLEYVETDLAPPAIIAHFQDHSASIDFPVEKVIETAFTALKQSSTYSFYRKKAWEVIHCYLAASLNLNDDKQILLKLFTYPSFQEKKIPHLQGSPYKSQYKRARETHQTALTGMFVAVAIKELNNQVFQTMIKVVRHYTMIAVAQQAGSFAITNRQVDQTALDPLVLVDALAAIMGHEEKELCKPGYVAMGLMLETANSILGSKEKACSLPLMEYLSERMCSLCYERAWYTKLGGCYAIKFLFERMAPRWVYDHLFVFLKALMFVMMDLTGEVSSGALDMAKVNLEKMLIVCVTKPEVTTDTPEEQELVAAQIKALYEVTHELVRQVTSPHTLVREQAMQSLRLLAEKQNKSVTEVIKPHKEVLADMIPPKKHLLRHQPANAQIGLMDGNTFCTTLEPRLFTINLTVLEHKIFVHELLTLCESEDADLSKFPCYKSVSSFTPLRKSALRALAACHYLEPKNYCDNIFNVLYKALERPNTELQETAFECMKKFIAGYQIDMKIVHDLMRPLLNMLGDYRTLNLNSTKRFSYLTKLFPAAFNEKFCEQLLEILKKLFEVTIQQNAGLSKNNENVQQIATIIDIFQQTPAASSKFIPDLSQLVLHTENALLIEASSPFRYPLMRFLLRYPAETMEYFLDDSKIKEQQYSRYLEYMLKHAEGLPFREHVQNNMVERLIKLLQANTLATEMTLNTRAELQYQSIRIISILVKFDKNWMRNHYVIVVNLNKIWCSEDYLERHKKVDLVEYTQWKEPKLIVKILLHDFCTRPGNPSMLFQLLRAFCDRFIPNFQFLKDFLENEVAQNYPVEWKRTAFFKFVELFPTNVMSQELKAKVLQLILIPCFAVSFQRGETVALIGSEPAPEQDSKDNVVSVFISELIDPDRPFGCADCVRISLLQFSCLLVEHAAPYIHDASNKQHGHKVRRLMTFAWPCLLSKSCVDPVTRYHGHILLSHIIDKFAIHRKIILQVFHSLLTAHAVEARAVVRQALDILTPSVPVRVEDGNTMFTHWTKKIIVEEGHSMQQLFHILQIVVRHFKVYYPVRHHIVQHMVNSIQRLGFSPTATIEHRKLAFELAEVIIKWELLRLKEEYDSSSDSNSSNDSTNTMSLKRSALDDGEHQRKKMMISTSAGQTSSAQSTSANGASIDSSSNKPIERAHADAIVNFLLRLACQVNDTSTAVGSTNAPGGASPGETLSRRCVTLLKIALKPDVWPQQVDLKLGFFDKIFSTVESSAPNYGNICTALELLTFLLGVMKKDQLLISFKPLQRGLVCISVASISCTNSKVIRLLHGFLTRLMSIFPTEPTDSNQASKHEELEILYSTVRKVIADGLTNYEKNLSASPSSLFGTLMMLKAACINNHSYIDRLITPFMKVLYRMAKEHLQPTSPDTSSVTVELLILSLDLVKTRVVVMGVEMRKQFIGQTLVHLIEKTSEVKIMKAIIKILEDWMKNKNPITLSQAPSLREKSILLVKLMQYVEKRFPEDLELNAQFLELVNYVYRDKVLKSSELTSKLEPAFLAGLRCTQPHIRAKFFEVFDDSMRRKLHDRLMYITCSQNWDAMGPHYWIKQCIELLIVTATPGTAIKMCHESSKMPSISSVINLADGKERDLFINYINPQRQDEETDCNTPVVKEEVLDLDISESIQPLEEKKPSLLPQTLAEHAEFLEMMRNVCTDQFLLATAQLCHMDTALAEHVWLNMFPRLWDILDEQQKHALTGEILPFVTSGTHTIQKDCHPSALNTFVESLSRCNPPIQIIPPLMKYIGKSHNLWHRMALGLEQMVFDPTLAKPKRELMDCYDFEPDQTSKNDLMDSLGELYWLLCEEDMWAGLWQRHAHYRETNIAIAYEQQGFFEQAQLAYENAMTKHKQDALLGPAPYHAQREIELWMEHWIRCAKELNQWDGLLEYARKGHYDPYLMLESSWHIPDWETMKEALTNVEYNCPKEMAWRVTLYGGFLAICHPKEKHLQHVERYVETASSMCMKEWRRLPHIVSHIHLPYLQAVQQIIELQEAAQIYQGLSRGHPSSLHDMNAIVKTWRNRLPVIADDLTHWSDIFTWRQHHYQFIVIHYDSQHENATKHDPAMKPSMVGVHASAQAIIHFAKIARKHNLPSVCLDSLSRIYTIPSVPIVDCFQKIRQQVKCYLLMASLGDKNSLQEALDALVSTNVSYFPTEMTAMIAELYALKGMVLALTGCSDGANKEFSAAVQLHDTLVKAWALYGDYLEQVFTKNPTQIAYGVYAITCFLHACRHQNESKARKYLSKVLWLLSYDDKKSSLMGALEKYNVGVPPAQWLPWTPQLLNCLVQYEGTVIVNLLTQVGRMFPQAVYFPIRTLYLTLRIEEREKYKTEKVAKANTQAAENSVSTPPSSQSSSSSSGLGSSQGSSQSSSQGSSQGLSQSSSQSSTTSSGSQPTTTPATTSTTTTTTTTSDTGPIRATPQMWRCSKIMHMQRDIHPTVLCSLEGIVDQMVWFRENWYEEVLRQLRQALAKCYAIAFENRDAVSETKITPHIFNFVKKLVSTFGIGVENISSSVSSTFISAASESLARRAEATYQDPVFQEMKVQFTTDFNFSQPGALRLHNLIFKLKKWIKILENRSKMLIQSFLIEEKCRYLSNFSLKTAEVELPGEFLLPKHSHYYVRIARFMPRVDIVQKHNTAARRLYIRGHNGKIYPYLVVNDSGLADARREERVLQLLRMLNHYLGKQKETSRRFLHFTVPRVVAVSPQMRLVEDNPASISLLDIYKKGCSKLGIEHDAPISYYYERLAAIQGRVMKASHQVYRDILKGVQTTMVPRTILRDWAISTYPSATDYWHFRKMFTLQLSLACFAEYILHLTRLNPDMMYLHQDSGLMNVSYFKFDVNDATGKLDESRPVPFRLTPNIIEYLSCIGISGPLTASMIAAARCLVYPNFRVQTILRTIIRDEMVAGHKKKHEEIPPVTDPSVGGAAGQDKQNAGQDMQAKQIIDMVIEAVNVISKRLNSLAHLDGSESKVSTLVAAASSHDNLCRMDPAWHPWL